MADAFLNLPVEDRREVLGVAADRSGRPAHLLQKDVWVVWALATGMMPRGWTRPVLRRLPSLTAAWRTRWRATKPFDLMRWLASVTEGLIRSMAEPPLWVGEVDWCFHNGAVGVPDAIL